MGRDDNWLQRWSIVLDLILFVGTTVVTVVLLGGSPEYPSELVLMSLVGMSIAGAPLAFLSWIRGDGIGRFRGLWAAQGVYSAAMSVLLYNAETLFGSPDGEDWGLFVASWVLLGLWVVTYAGIQLGVGVAAVSKFPEQTSERVACILQLAHVVAVAAWITVYLFEYGL
jgi:hypothetical protein